MNFSKSAVAHQVIKPVLSFSALEECITDVKWSTCNPLQFASCDAAGHVNVWDLSRDFEVPIAKYSAFESAMYKLSYDKDGRNLAAATSDGQLLFFDTSHISTRSSTLDTSEFLSKLNDISV